MWYAAMNESDITACVNILLILSKSENYYVYLKSYVTFQVTLNKIAQIGVM